MGLRNMHESSAGLNVIFDSLIFGQAARSPLARGGIYRYASQLLQAFQAEPDLSLRTYCPEPLLASLAQSELTQLVDGSNPFSRSGFAPNLARNTPSVLIKLAKPLLRWYAQLPPARLHARQRFKTLLDTFGGQPTLFHTPFQAVPPVVRRKGSLPVVVTVHDMLPLIMPEMFTRETIRSFQELVQSLRKSDQVICVSEATKRDFLRFNHTVASDQVHVTPLAASPGLKPITDPVLLLRIRERYGLNQRDRVILSLCTLEPRKNLTTLLTAFEHLHRHSPLESLKLVLAGSEGWKSAPLLERIRDSSAASAIVLTGYVAEADLSALYSLADVFVYPSLYEGFGLPPLEAMRCGTPVIVGNTSSLQEVTGDAGLVIDPRSASELSSALERLLGSESLNRQLAQRCKRQADQFSWSHTARLTLDVYRLALASRG